MSRQWLLCYSTLIGWFIRNMSLEDRVTMKNYTKYSCNSLAILFLKSPSPSFISFFLSFNYVTFFSRLLCRLVPVLFFQTYCLPSVLLFSSVYLQFCFLLSRNHTPSLFLYSVLNITHLFTIKQIPILNYRVRPFPDIEVSQ